MNKKLRNYLQTLRAFVWEPDQELDASGWQCPNPILRARKVLAEMLPGQVLRVLTTDAGSLSDIPLFCRQRLYKLVASGETDGKQFFLIRKLTGSLP